MEWKGDHLIYKKEKKQITDIINNICINYKVKPPTYIEINKRLRANDGIYKWGVIYKNQFETSISLAYKHYIYFGIDSLIKVLKHEIAHHICCMRGKNIDHGPYFKKLCKKIGGCLGLQLATGKYSNLSYIGIETPYKWYYKCPTCKIDFYTKRKLNENNTVCNNCDTEIWKFEKRKL